ncbi:MAG: glycosyltransferase family 39 protein [Lentisphaeria bacterium]|nr:glycosyltransferase family 39 protein [Lentisphaeria bacterium]
MPYVERTPTRRSVLLLLLVFALLYLPFLPTRELRPSEALYGTVAAEMVRERVFWTPAVHGDPVDAYPLYPWLVALCDTLGCQGEWGVRLPAVLCLGVLALLSGWMAHRHGGPVAAFVAAGMVLCNVAAIRVGRRAQSEIVLALLLTCAWWTWFALGQEGKRWLAGWLGAALFVTLAAFTGGARALAMFYLPFFFLRRPVKGRRRMLLPSHFAALAFLALAVGTWLYRSENPIFLPWNELQTMPRVTLSYPLDFVLFPLKCAVYLFPWSFLIWPAFCMAYRPLERSPIVFHFLRTIVLSLFLVSWLLPKVSPLSLMSVLGPLAVMTGLHFELLVRRHLLVLRRLSRLLAHAAAVLALAGLGLCLIHGSGIVRVEGWPRAHLAGMGVLLALALAVALLVAYGPLARAPFRNQFVAAAGALGVAVLSLITPWQAWANNEQSAAGLALAGRAPPSPILLATPPGADAAVSGAGGVPEGGAVPREAVAGVVPNVAEVSRVYRPIASSAIYSTTRPYHVAACFYLSRPVVRVTAARTRIPIPHGRSVAPFPSWGDRPDIPALPPQNDPGAQPYVDAVYVLTEGSAPILPEVEWTPVSPALDLRRRKIVRVGWFPGGPRLARLYTEAAPPDPGQPPDIVRLFRGVRR